VAEVGGFGPIGLAVNELANAGENQKRGELSGDDIHLTDTEIVERILVKLSRFGQSFDSNAESEFWCMEFSHFFGLEAIHTS
jgi:hypothetical protein